MGMYTEIYVKIALKEDAPGEVVDALKYMIGILEDVPATLPDHELFSTARWDFMLRCSSYYHVPKTVKDMWYDDIANQWFIVSRSDFKNYNGEAEKFFDWISPYVYAYTKTFIGYTLYEEDVEPTLHYVGIE